MIVLLLSLCIPGKPISSPAESAAENFYALGFLNVAGKLIFVLSRVGYALAFLWPILVERVDRALG